MSKSYVADMHTAEHLLNATMVAQMGTERCFSAHVNKKKSKCDYHFHRPMTDEEANAVEQGVNAILALGVDVTEEFMDRDAAAEKFNLTRLPDDAGDTLRIVKVGEHDSCPCIGEHVSNTAEVGVFRMVSHSFEEGVLRIRFKLKRPQ